MHWTDVEQWTIGLFEVHLGNEGETLVGGDGAPLRNLFTQPVTLGLCAAKTGATLFVGERIRLNEVASQ